MSTITDANVISFIRSLIGEATVKHWTDDEITLYKQFGMMEVMNKYWYLLAPMLAEVTATSLVANTEYVSYDADMAKILRVEVAETGKSLRKIEPDELWKYSEYDDGAAATNYLNVWWLSYSESVTEFPPALRPLIAMEAAMYAKLKDTGAVDGAMLRMYEKFEAAALTFLSTDSMYEPTVFGDYELEEGYTYANPCAWLFRSGKIYLYKTKG